MKGNRFDELNVDPALAEAVSAASGDRVIEGIVRLENPSELPVGFQPIAQFTRICTGRFRAGDAWKIRKDPNVLSLKAARLVGAAEPAHGAQRGDMPRGPRNSAFRPFTGRGSVVAMLDFGFDLGHDNFRNEDGTTRLLALWHQGAAFDATRPNRYGYGRIFSRKEIDAALRETDPYQALGYHPAISDNGDGSHGTHTTDIAAGKGRTIGSARGIAPEADLLFVHLSTPRSAGNLGDSVRMLEALHYVHHAAGQRPCAINLSVGQTAGPHDGSSLFEQGMHELLRAAQGRAIVQSAGNYRSAHLAVNGWLQDGTYRDLEWIIDPRDTTENEIDAWYSGNDRFLVALQSPTMSGWIEVPLGRAVDLTEDDELIGRIFHRKNDPTNNANHIDVFLYPNAPAGVWRLRLYGEYVINGRFHAWIERESSSPGGQSRFDRGITSQAYTLGTIATSPLVLTVGAFDPHAHGAPLADFSSCGPTRDGRHEKPELLAPGVDIVAARSVPWGATQQDLLVAKSGTSMAAPVVTGTIAAMFEAAGRPLFIEEIRDCLKGSASGNRNDAETDCCGWGRIDIDAALAAASLLRPKVPAEDDMDVVTHGRAASGQATITAAETNQPSKQSGGTMREEFEPAERNAYLDWAEHLVVGPPADEGSAADLLFLRLMREMGGDALEVETPAALFREAAREWAKRERLRQLFRIVGLPGYEPRLAPQAGDWMLRFVPGVGHSGHMSLLASPKLIPYAELAFHGLTAESNRPGYYGLVMEAGAFPHFRDSLFARRLLDGRLRVPINTIVLRPSVLPGPAKNAWSSRDEAAGWNTGRHRTSIPPWILPLPEEEVAELAAFDSGAQNFSRSMAVPEASVPAYSEAVSIDEQSDTPSPTLVPRAAGDLPEFRAIMVKGWADTEDLVTKHPKKYASLLASFQKAQEAGKGPGDWLDNTPTEKITVYQDETGKAAGLVFFANMNADTDGKASPLSSSDKTHQSTTSLKWMVDGLPISLDPETVPYVALPPELVAASGARLGDLVRMKDGDKVFYGVYGDGGPHLKSGEASMKVQQLFGRGLGGSVSDRAEYQRIEYTILTGSGARYGLGMRGHGHSSDEIQQIGEEVYQLFVRRIRHVAGSNLLSTAEQTPVEELPPTNRELESVEVSESPTTFAPTSGGETRVQAFSISFSYPQTELGRGGRPNDRIAKAQASIKQAFQTVAKDIADLSGKDGRELALVLRTPKENPLQIHLTLGKPEELVKSGVAAYTSAVEGQTGAVKVDIPIDMANGIIFDQHGLRRITDLPDVLKRTILHESVHALLIRQGADSESLLTSNATKFAVTGDRDGARILKSLIGTYALAQEEIFAFKTEGRVYSGTEERVEKLQSWLDNVNSFFTENKVGLSAINQLIEAGSKGAKAWVVPYYFPSGEMLVKASDGARMRALNNSYLAAIAP